MTKIKENELCQRLSELDYRYKLVIYTDRADFADEVTDVDKLLELRAFDENGEFRAYRDIVGVDFKIREINGENPYDGYYDTAQYLDIDTSAAGTSECEKKTTGGGTFHMPDDVKNRELLLVRYYYKFDGDGVARKCDWRLVGFTDREVR